MPPAVPAVRGISVTIEAACLVQLLGPPLNDHNCAIDAKGVIWYSVEL